MHFKNVLKFYLCKRKPNEVECRIHKPCLAFLQLSFHNWCEEQQMACFIGSLAGKNSSLIKFRRKECQMDVDKWLIFYRIRRQGFWYQYLQYVIKLISYFLNLKRYQSFLAIPNPPGSYFNIRKISSCNLFFLISSKITLVDRDIFKIA